MMTASLIILIKHKLILGAKLNVHHVQGNVTKTGKQRRTYTYTMYDNNKKHLMYREQQQKKIIFIINVEGFHQRLEAVVAAAAAAASLH